MTASQQATWRSQVLLIIFAQFTIILALDMSDPYWPLILSVSHVFSTRTLQYWSGVIYVAPLLTTIFTTLFWAKIGERIGYKKMVLRAGFALAVTQFSLFFFVNPWAILGIRLIQGGVAGFTAAAQAWSLAVTPTNTHSQTVGRLQSASAMGSIVGPVCGGLISHYYGYVSIFITSGCMCVLIAIILAKYLKENSRLTPFEIKNGKFFLRDPGKNFLLLLICGAQAARWMSTPFFALYMVKQLHANNLTIGFMYATMALSMSLITSTLGQMIDKRLHRRVAVGYLLIVALFLGGLTQWGFFLCIVLSSFFCWRTYFVDECITGHSSPR